MKNIIEVFSDIGFNDASYKGCEMLDGMLLIFLTLWNEKEIKLIFSNPILFFYKQGDVIEGFYECKNSSPILNEALSLEYDYIPNNHPYKLYQILDIYDLPFFQVVADKVELQYL
jgi:hypothetical protein